MRNIILEKVNGEVIQLPKTKEVVYGLHDGSKIGHLCFDCVNGCASKCVKVADYSKKPITAYDFIINGYQIYNNRGMMTEFVVTNCQNFKYDAPSIKSKKDKMEAEKIRNDFRLAYYGASDVQEMKEIRRNLQLALDKNKQIVKTK